MDNTLIMPIGDCHVTNGQDLSRFDHAGKLILKYKPAVIVLMGDFLTLNCLSFWDKNKKKKMEGRRYKKEIAAGNEALDRMLGPTVKLQNRQKKNKVKMYNPELVYLMGNHEERLHRYLDADPTFDGVISIEEDLKLDDRGFIVVPYKSYYEVNGISFTHIPFNKMREIASVNICRAAEQVCVGSTVFAHTHEYNVSNIHRAGQTHLQQLLNCGCFFDKTEEYAQGHLTNYWKGLMLLDNYKEGRFDVNTFSTGHLRRLYG
jgi:hypothetical protein